MASPDGLSQSEATKRLAQYGPNEIAEKKTNPLLKFLSYFWGPIPLMIEVAVVLSGVVRHWPDFFQQRVVGVLNPMSARSRPAGYSRASRQTVPTAFDHTTSMSFSTAVVPWAERRRPRRAAALYRSRRLPADTTSRPARSG